MDPVRVHAHDVLLGGGQREARAGVDTHREVVEVSHPEHHRPPLHHVPRNTQDALHEGTHVGRVEDVNEYHVGQEEDAVEDGVGGQVVVHLNQVEEAVEQGQGHQRQAEQTSDEEG